MINYLTLSCCMTAVVRVVMMTISLHLLLWVGIVKVWPGVCHETRPFYAGRFAPDQWLQRSPGRLRLARKAGFLVALKDCLRLEKGSSKNFQAAQGPKPGSWQQVKDVISIFRVQSLTLKQILGLSTLRKPFPISNFRKYIGALTLNSSLGLLVMYIIGLNC